MSIPDWLIFKILKFSEPSLPGMTSSTLQPHFLFGGFIMTMVIVISFACERKTVAIDNAPALRGSNSSKHYQTEWQDIIKKND